MIEIDRLRKGFGPVEALRDVSFVAPDGAITGLLGANGAGKSTTLRIVCGVLKTDSGSVRVDGIATDADPILRRTRIGALLDQSGIYPRLTARENLAYFGALRGMSGAALRENASHVISLLGMENIADRRTAGFSHGERMKVALGRALIHSPKTLLLDEPTNGLDVPAVRALRQLLSELRDEGVCIVFSSHVLEEVRVLCDRVAIISGGRVVAEGTTDGLCRQAAATSLEDAFIRLTEGTGGGNVTNADRCP
jgi:sodium transport system ATP-binding protein